MKLTVGDSVLIRSLNKSGTVLEITSGGKYNVRIGNMTITCAEKDLKYLEKKKKQERAIPAGSFQESASQKQRQMSTEIDLHGKTVDEALHLVPYFLSDLIVAGYKEASIVHGIGTGALRTALHRYFQSESTIKRFELDRKNPGVTKVFL